MSADPTGTDADEGIQLPDTLLASAEALLNRLLALDPEGAARLAAIQGRVLRVELTGFGTRIHLVPTEQGLMLYGRYDAEPDCTVRGTPAALLRMAVSEHREDQVFAGAIRIDGDNGVAQTLGEVLKGLDIDWEEQVSRLLGDTLAHRIGVQTRSAGRWASRSGEVLTRDLREYLIEEGRLLPGDDDMRAFLDGVDTLRDDVERLEARVERLVDRLGADQPR
jgi:ubiquinone biosynthesis protein UbiJ